MKCLLISLADFHLLGQVCPLRFRWSSLASPLVLRSSRLSERARVASREDNTLDKYYNNQSLPPRWCVPVQHRNNSGVELCGSAPLAKAHPFSSATFNSTRQTDGQTNKQKQQLQMGATCNGMVLLWTHPLWYTVVVLVGQGIPHIHLHCEMLWIFPRVAFPVSTPAHDQKPNLCQSCDNH